MSYPGNSTFVRFVGVALVMTFALTLQAAPGDEYWDDGFYLKGLSASVNAAVVDERGDIIVSGSFLTADDVMVDHIARWDGTRWHPLGDGLNSSARVLVFDDNGDLYAGGTFDDAGGDPDADNIAVWDGLSWSSLGGHDSGLSTSVFALAFDSNGDLYAGGNFTNAGGDPDADRIAVWNGTAWSSIGGADSGVNSNVNAVAFSSGGILVIGGYFTDAGGSQTADFIAGWNGSGWNAIGGGLNGAVNDLVFTANGDLYVGGSFTDAGGVPDADRIAVWSSPTWRTVGAGGGLDETVHDIAFDSSGTLLVGGEFDNAGGDPNADRVARWTPAGWTSVGGSHSGLNYDVSVLVIDDGDAPVVGGNIHDVGGNVAVDYLARWNGSQWVALSRASLPTGSGLKGSVFALAHDGAGRLYAGGDFYDAGNDRAGDYVAMWDGLGWSALGGPTAALDGYVFALAFSDAGDLVVGGEFWNAGGDPDANHIALWDGVDWSSLGGPDSGLDGDVNALAVGDDGRIYAGGDFDDAGGDPDGDHVAVWDGVAWSALVGPGGGPDGEIFDLYIDAGAGHLFAVGDFYDAGGDPDADYVAVWNGSAWASIGGPGSGLDSYAYALAIDDAGRVYVGGDFTDAGGNPDADYIAMWDGVSWTVLGTGLNDIVRDLAFDGVGNLYAVGQFDPGTSDPTHPREIAVWDGVSWESLGSGIEDDGYALFYDGGWNVFVGGAFFWAGDKPSSKIGCYTGATPAGLLFVDGFESGNTSAWSN